MQIAERYDVICVGGSFSSYLSAALLSNAGCKVLLIDEQESCSPHDVDGRTVFDPDLAPIWGLDFENPLSRSLKQLGILGPELSESFTRCSGISQILNSQHRIHLSFDKEKALRELRSELPENDEALGELFELFFRSQLEIPRYSEQLQTIAEVNGSEIAKTLKFWGKFGRAAIGKETESVQTALSQRSSITNAFLSALLSTLSPVSPRYVGCEQIFRTLSVAIRGQAFWFGGIDALKGTLLRTSIQNGAQVIFGANVRALVQENERIEGVLLSSYDGAVFADYTLLTTHLRKTYMTLPSSVADPTVVRNLSRVYPSHWRYTIAVSLNKDVIPVGATDLMTCVGSYKLELEEENLLRIMVVPEGIFTETDTPDTVTVHVTALVPYRASSLNYGYLRRLGGKMLHALAEIIPFFEYNVVSMYPDIRKGEDDLRSLYPFNRPEWVSENLLTYYVRGGHECQDFSGVSWSTPHENLYFAGRACLPTLGVYGEAAMVEKIVRDLVFPQRWRQKHEDGKRRLQNAELFS